MDGENRSIKDYPEEFILLLKVEKPEIINIFKDLLQDELQNYDHKIIIVVADPDKLKGLYEGMEYVVAESIEGKQIDLNHVYLLVNSGEEQKLLFNCEVSRGDQFLVKNLKLRMNKVLDSKFSSAFRSID